MAFGLFSFAEDSFAALGSTSIDVSVTGVVGTSALGSESVVAEANVAVTGVVGTSAVGSVTTVAKANVAVTGVAGTSALGSVTPTANSNVIITEGFELTSALNTVNVWGLVAQGISTTYTPVSDDVSTTYTPVSTTQTPNWQEVA